MAQEIERKFLVKSNIYKTLGNGMHYHQGYICSQTGRTVRVRIAGTKAFLTIKSKVVGISRNEYEYEIPVQDAEEMLELLCDKPTIEKIRYRIPADNGLIWEVDEFFGDNAGLVVAEIELPNEEFPFTCPDWIGQEVTGDRKYYNSSLCKFPYKEWNK